MPRVKKVTPVKKTSKSNVMLEGVKRPIASKKKDSIKPIKLALQNDKRRTLKSTLSVPVYTLSGRAAGVMSLPKETFGAKVNQKLLAQAVRVYSTNEARLPGSTKKRGEVHGTTAKMYRQKGTGRARHGAKTAPIFVGGGVAFGPKPRINNLSLPLKMKRAALVSAVSAKALDKQVFGISGAEKASGKTKEVASLIEKIAHEQSTLIVTGEKLGNLTRAAGNIKGVHVLPVNLINAYEVLRHQVLLITKDALEKLK